MNEEQPIPQPLPGRQSKKRSRSRQIIIASTALVIIAGAAFGGWLYLNRATSPVPKSIIEQANFPVYYPIQKQLPKGYMLEISSFKSPQPGVVIYNVRYGDGKKLVFSVQQKPGSADLSSFVKQYIPINRKVLTDAGTATIGAIGQQTVVSLPNDDGSWVIMTGPADIYTKDQLAQVLKSLAKQ